jgi:hypothetical protein
MQFTSFNSSQFDGALFSPSSNFALSGGPFTGVQMFNVEFDFDGGIAKVYVNGILNAQNSYTTKLGTSLDLLIFSNRLGNKVLNGQCGEIVISEDISENSRNKIEGYLAHRWGTVSDLPSNHPYKSFEEFSKLGKGMLGFRKDGGIILT